MRSKYKSASLLTWVGLCVDISKVNSLNKRDTEIKSQSRERESAILEARVYIVVVKVSPSLTCMGVISLMYCILPTIQLIFFFLKKLCEEEARSKS